MEVLVNQASAALIHIQILRKDYIIPIAFTRKFIVLDLLNLKAQGSLLISEETTVMFKR